MSDDGEVHSAMVISLADAADNCKNFGGMARVYLRGGQMVQGKIDRSHEPGMPLHQTVHLKTKNGGWATLRTDEVIGVEVLRVP